MTGNEAQERIYQAARAGLPPGLTRIRKLLGCLGNPHEQLKFIHIAGTNGKGSTAAMTASVLVHAGFKTGLYTSPHLWRFNERFQINGRPIPDQILDRLTEQVLQAVREMGEPVTEFEMMTALGMLYFREEQCDCVVLEVGLGGRLDSTNVIPAPEVAAITNIGLEHTQLLGNTLPEIAKEKAGIIKSGSSVILYHQTPQVEAVVEGICAQKGCSLTITAPETLTVQSMGLNGQQFTYRGKGPYQLSLLGEYQLLNAASALEILWALADRGWDIPERAISQGLCQAAWPGRLELVRRSPFVLLDGGHNPQCFSALAHSLRQLCPGQRYIFLVGVLKDKDYPTMMSQLLPIGQIFITVPVDSPRALPSQELADYLRRQGAEVHPCGSLKEGVQAALSLARSDDMICACGSLYMIGSLRHLLLPE